MNITRFVIKNKVVTSVLIALTLVAGLATYFSLPRAEDPGFTVRTAIVTTFFPGASPERVEHLVTDRLEEEIEEIEEVDFIESESRTGASVIQVNIQHKYTDMTPIWDELRQKVADAAPELPAEAVGPFVNDEFGAVFSNIVMMTGEGFSWAELEEIGEEVRARLLRLDHVAKVELIGTQEQRIYIEYDEARLADMKLSAASFAGMLQERNILLAGGEVRTDREQIQLEPSGNFNSVEDIQQTTFALPSGELVALQDVAEVRRGYIDPATQQATYQGRPALALAVSMREDGKATELGPALLNELDAIRSQLPVGIDFHTVNYRAAIVDKGVNAFTSSLLQGIVAVLLVVLVALGLRTGLVVASIVPITMVGSLLFMAALDISLNKVSLAGLIMALGILVDCAIVVAESMIVQMREGKKPVAAATDSVKELAFPLFVGAATTSLALLATYIAEHQVSEFVSAIFEVVSVALFLSWVLALTVLPMFCVTFLNNHRAKRGNGSSGEGPGGGLGDSSSPGGRSRENDEYDSRFYAWYRQALLWTLRHRAIAIIGSVVLLGLALYSMRFVPQTFFPRKAETLFSASIELPYGTPFERTRAAALDLEAFAHDSLGAELEEAPGPLWRVPRVRSLEVAQEGIVNSAAFLGSGAPRYILGYAPEQPRINYAYLLLNATSYEIQDTLIPRMEAFMAEHYPEATVRIEKLRNGPPLDYPVEIRLSGNDPDRLFTFVEQVKDSLRAMEGVVNVNDDWGRRIKKLHVDVDDNRARRAGLTNRDVAVSLQTNLSGFPLTEYREGNDLIPVVLRSNTAGEDGLAKLNGLSVFSQRTGQSVPLGQVADVALAFEPSKILRYDRQRTVTVRADIASGADRSVTPFSVVDDIEAWLAPASETWPLGYDYASGGEPETSGEARNAVRSKLPLSLLLILLVLVFEFNSLRKPAIILLTLPFAFIGVVLGLLITQMQFGFMALLGVIALVGIIINNAVVLIDRIDVEQRDFGRSAADAVIEASQRRFRPILLTACTTVGGLLPLWLGGDVMFQPMAVAMIFGLLVSTGLTLGLVPVLYSLFFRVDFSGYTYARS